ncbi:hypothetical protein HOG98_05985 [bacterium]|jgi:hypothetical protein|nr:hypothetical protein [bacterium]
MVGGPGSQSLVGGNNNSLPMMPLLARGDDVNILDLTTGSSNIQENYRLDREAGYSIVDAYRRVMLGSHERVPEVFGGYQLNQLEDMDRRLGTVHVDGDVLSDEDSYSVSSNDSINLDPNHGSTLEN